MKDISYPTFVASTPHQISFEDDFAVDPAEQTVVVVEDGELNKLGDVSVSAASHVVIASPLVRADNVIVEGELDIPAGNILQVISIEFKANGARGPGLGTIEGTCLPVGDPRCQ